MAGTKPAELLGPIHDQSLSAELSIGPTRSTDKSALPLLERAFSRLRKVLETRREVVDGGGDDDATALYFLAWLWCWT